MNLDLAFVNGEVLSAKTASISPLDAGFQLGVGIYETLSVERGKPVFLREHLLRMEESRRWMALPAPRWDVRDAVTSLLSQAGPGSAALRITLTQGIAQSATLAITLREIPQAPPLLRLWVSSHRKNAGDPWERIKTTGRARNVKAREEALARGAFEAILPTSEGDFAEGSVSNLFVVSQGALLTPPLDRGCLPGVTRDKILACARELGIPVLESRIDPDSLAGADLVLISNSLVGLLGAEEVIGHWKRRKEADDAILRKLGSAYQALVAIDLRLPDEGAELQSRKP